MHRNSLRNAYDTLKPDGLQKERMLKNILQQASVAPDGRKDVAMPKKNRLLLIAAVISMAILLMGSAIIWKLEDMKIGEYTVPAIEFTDESGMTVTEQEKVMDVISLQGFGDSPGVLAAKEWYEFRQSYDLNFERITEAERSGFEAPGEYAAYNVYTQEMMDKVDEICDKYGLGLAGESVLIQSKDWEVFQEALGLEILHDPLQSVKVRYRSGYFYACGNFDANFDVILTGEKAAWKHTVLVSMRYSDKEYLDTVSYTVSDIESAQQWEYETAGGTQVWMALSDDLVRIFCDREDAFVAVYFDTRYYGQFAEVDTMTREDMEAIADVIDFTVVPQKPDVEKAQEKINAEEAALQEQLDNRPKENDEAIYSHYIRGRLESLENPENIYYTMLDVNEDGTVDLLLGSRENPEVVWTVMDDSNDGTRHITFSMPDEETMTEIEKAWLNMEIYPITEYPLS